MAILPDLVVIVELSRQGLVICRSEVDTVFVAG